MKPLLIGHISNSVETRLAGGETYLLALFEHAGETTHKVVCRRGSALAAEVRARGIDSLEIDFGLGRFRRNVVEIANYFRQARIDLIQAHGFFPAWLALEIGKRTDLPVILTAHNQLEDAADGRPAWRASLELFGRRRLVSRLWPRAAAIVAVTDAVKASLCMAGIPDGAVTVIYNGIDVDKVRSAAEEKISSELAPLPDPPIIGTVSRLEPFKGVENVLKVAEYTRQSQRDLTFIVVGEGSRRRSLMDAIEGQGLSGRVRLIGHVDRPAPLMRHFTAYFMSSPREGINRAALEAGALGVPLILGRNRPEAFVDGITAFIAAADTPEQVAAKIETIRHSPDLAESVGQKGALLIARSFSARAMAGNILEVYERVLATG